MSGGTNDVYAVLGTICVLAALALLGMWRTYRAARRSEQQ